MQHIKSFRNNRRPSLFGARHAAAFIALSAIAFVSPSAVRAQDNHATIFGQAPAGELVTAISSTGLHRHQTVNKAGRFRISPLPLGVYEVTLQNNGETVKTRSNISLYAGVNAEVDFACPEDHCAAPETP